MIWMTGGVSGRGGGEACAVGHDVGGVGCCGGRVDLDGGHSSAVDECLDAEVEVGLGTGDGGAEVLVAVADVDDGGVVAVDLDDWRLAVARCRRGR